MTSLQWLIAGGTLSLLGYQAWVAWCDWNAEWEMFQTRSSKDTAHENIDVHVAK